jgi:anti-anti-sigma factor
VLAPKGRIGSVTAPAFEEAIKAAVTAAPRVVVDLTDVDYISGAGIRALQQTTDTNGGRTILCGLHDAVRIALELSRALADVVVAKDKEEALESLIRD